MKSKLLLLALLLHSSCCILHSSAQTQLWSMALFGGANGDGAIIKMNLDGSGYTRPLDFYSGNGANPNGSLIQATNGKLYGMTWGGGANGDGVLFSFDPYANTYSDLLDFNDSANGKSPFGSLMQASNGKLYGMTGNGGSNSDGILFSFDPSSNTYSKLLDFNGSNGANPNGSLMQASNGKLYGMTSAGGSNNKGVVFSFDPADSIYAKLRDLNPPDGTQPQYSNFIEVANTNGISELSADETISVFPNPLTSSSILQLNTRLKNAEVVIYDMVGKEMMRKKLTGDKMEIDKGSLESGVYFVKVVSDERQWVEKMVVE